MSASADHQASEPFPGAVATNSPCVVVDAARLAANIAGMQKIADEGGVALHPHIKTHKSLAIAEMQREAGAQGITASHPAEAAVFIRAGFSPVTLAYPLVRSEPVAALLDLSKRYGVSVRFIADSAVGVAALGQGAEQAGKAVEVFMKVDTGLHRCGVDPAAADAVALAKAINTAPRLLFAGLLSHAGHSYGGKTLDGVLDVARQEAQTLATLKAKLQEEGVPVPLVSVGSTPTLVKNAGFDGIDEVRPGNYVFYDMTAVRLGIARRNDIALAVCATVISKNRDCYVIDAGSKTLSSDLGPHSVGGAPGYGEVWSKALDRPLTIDKLSEEHGLVGRENTDLEIGAGLLIYPNHACVVANLAPELTLLSGDGITRLAVDAADPVVRRIGY